MIEEILTARIAPRRYLRLLASLEPIYHALEAGLHRHRHHPILEPFARPELFRREALRHDRDRLAHALRVAPPPPVAEAVTLGRRIAGLAEARPELLLAHAYVRHLGDLSGGPILARRLACHPGIGPAAIAFYEFPGIDDLTRAKAEYRAALDRVGPLLDRPEAVIDEACRGFVWAIALFDSVRASEPTDVAQERRSSSA